MVGKGASAGHSEMQLMAGMWKGSPGSLQWGPRLACPQECHKMVIRNGPYLLALCTSWWAVLEQSENKRNHKREVRLQFAPSSFPRSNPAGWCPPQEGTVTEQGGSWEPWHRAGTENTQWVVTPSHRTEAVAELVRAGANCVWGRLVPSASKAF